MDATTAKPARIDVRVRNFELPFEKAGFDRHWHGSPCISHFWSALSQSFEPGERFFIDAVRHYRDSIDDPALRAEIDQFSGQEAVHTRQHVKFNRMVGEHGYDVDTMRGRYARLLDDVRAKNDPMLSLAITMALEHFTSGFAHRYLSEPSVSEGADPGVVALWKWHSMEEVEHKSTAFDVFRAVNGRYSVRVLALAPAWFLILAVTFRNVYDMLKADGRLGDFRDLWHGFVYLCGPRGFLTGLVPGFLRYYSPRFHPWELDDSHFIDEWEASHSAPDTLRNPVGA